MLTVALVPLAVIAVLLGILGFLQVYNGWKFYYRVNSKMPYVKEKLFLGAFQAFPGQIVIGEHMKRLGPIFYASIFTTPLIVVCDPDIIQHALLKESFPKGLTAGNVKELWGENLVIMDHVTNPNWKKERRLAEPAFKMSALKILADGIFGIHAREFTQQLIQISKENTQSVNMPDMFSLLTLEILSTSGFSYPLDMLKEKVHDQNPFLKSVQDLLTGVVSPFAVLPGGGKVLKWRYQKQTDTVNKVFYKVIDDRLAERASNPELSEKPRDLLDLLLMPDEQGNSLDREQLRNELLLFYIAGHETTSTCLSWFIYCLCIYPEVAAKVYEEIDNLLGLSDGKTLVSPTSEQIEEMIYTKMVLNETLRCYPPSRALIRQVPETFEMKGQVFPKGSNIMISVRNTHRNPAHWPNPEKFNPERFSKENSASRHMMAFIPFGAGNRICIGRKFFLNEALVIIGTMLREVRFELDTSQQNGVSYSGEATDNKPVGVWVKVHRRIHPLKN